MVTIERQSPITGVTHTTQVDLTPEEFEVAYAAWVSGVYIQVAFPTLDADQREFIKTGIPPHEWDEIFPEE
jgi:hypothetical protein